MSNRHLGFNYEFNALDPAGKSNELNEAFRRFRAKEKSDVVSLMFRSLPVLRPIVKLFVSSPFHSRRQRRRD